MKYLLIVFIFLLVSRPIFANQNRNIPKDGYVPDEKTAVAIAEAVLTPIFGKEMIEEEKPFEAILQGEVWVVNGTLHCPEGQLCLGGVATAEISKQNGTIIRTYHSQ